ncbi:4053_t:CDS:1 [Acaulospora morrowiae]|uniref:4053_t:CDS:1 n=1 Tax=Acaulospora morrowiae TaxID=94023 RepID=A0A9N9EBZ9_9GLOM|nr:4053_t:CDS:1 [Acaulospora morrowiae]
MQKWIAVSFVMMMIFSWIVFGLISIKIYWKRKRNIFGNTLSGRLILFNDGLLYLAANALFQLINIIFIFAGKDYIIRFANVTPAFLVTSVCCQRLLVLGATSTKHHSSIIRSTLPSFHQDNNNPIFPQQSNESSIINNNAPEFPPSTVHRPHHPTLQTLSVHSQFPASITIDPPTPIMNSDFSSSLLSIMNNFTSMNNHTLNNHLHNSLSSLHSFGKNSSSHDTMKSRHSNNSNSNHSSNLSFHQNPESSSSLQANSNSQNQTRSSHESGRSNRSILTTIQNVFRSSREGRSRDEENDPNDVYYFRYSNVENDEDVYMFPKTPSRPALRK